MKPLLAHWNNSSWVDMSLHSDTLFWFQTKQFLLLHLNVVCLAEKQQIPILQSLVLPDWDLNPQSTTLRQASYNWGSNSQSTTLRQAN
jgi:hypothetical protein